MERKDYGCYTEMKSIVHRHFPLSDEICLPNSAYDFQSEGMPYLGHKQHLEYLNTVLLNNKYGAFLVTGFRGVGKTTLVQSAIKLLNTQLPSNTIAININLSTERDYIDVLFEISRKLHDEVKNSVVWSYLSRSERARIELINRRTLMDIKYSREAGGEISGSFGKNNTAKTLSASLEGKASYNFSEENTLRNLTVSDIEAEFTAIVKSIKKVMPESRIIIVLDEIDKLTQDQDGMNCFEDILRRAKGIISGTSAIFIFIAGVDVYEKWEQDSNRIDSLYDSLFSWQLYLPCVWDTSADLFNLFREKELVYKPVESAYKDLVKNETVKVLQEPFQILDQYFIFMGKGLPRKILRLFDGFVRRTNGTPYFILTQANYQKICKFSKLYQKFNEYKANSEFENEIDRDTHFILFLTMLDYLLQTKQNFSEKELTDSLLSENSVGTLRIKTVCKKLINVFLDKNIIIRDRSLSKNQKGYVISNIALQEIKEGITSEVHFPKKIMEESTIDVDLLLRNHVKKTDIAAISQYWNEFRAKKLAFLSEEISILYVVRNSTSYIASIYDRENRKEQKGASDGKYQHVRNYMSEFLPQMECLAVDDIPFSVVQTPTSGCLLSELVTANPKRSAINSIILQLLSFSLEMKANSFLRLPLSPGNIMVRSDGQVKILDPIPAFFQTEEKNGYTNSVFRAPETTPDPEGRTIVFSIGMIMLYLLLPYKFDHIVNDDTLDTERLIELADCSKAQKRLITKMVQHDIQKRPILDTNLIKNVKRCPEFWKKGKKISGESEKVTITYYYSGENEKPGFTAEDMWDEKTVLDLDQTIFDLLPPKNSNTITGDDEPTWMPEEFEEKAGKKASIIKDTAYLENIDTDERIPITVSPFIVGRDPECNYCTKDSLTSRKHFRIEYKDNDFYLYSEGATNGIMIDGEKREGEFSCLLKDGTVIEVGNTILVFFLS